MNGTFEGRPSDEGRSSRLGWAGRLARDTFGYERPAESKLRNGRGDLAMLTSLVKAK